MGEHKLPREHESAPTSAERAALVLQRTRARWDSDEAFLSMTSDQAPSRQHIRSAARRNGGAAPRPRFLGYTEHERQVFARKGQAALKRHRRPKGKHRLSSVQRFVHEDRLTVELKARCACGHGWGVSATHTTLASPETLTKRAMRRVREALAHHINEKEAA